jgi:hypothetical protein
MDHTEIFLEKESTRREFANLYPLRVPVPQYFDYYVQTVSKDPEYSWINMALARAVAAEKDLKELHSNSSSELSTHKFQILDKFVQECQRLEIDKALNSLPVSMSVALSKESKEFKPVDGGIYVSYDMSSANWQSIQVLTGIDTPFESFVEKLGCHPFFSGSKSYRQLLLGNLQPKRQNWIQCQEIAKLVKELREISVEPVGISSDEIVILASENNESVEKIFTESKFMFVKRDFSTSIVKSFEDIIRIDKTSLPSLVLKGVSGNRYYLHYKRHILKEEIEERDMFFRSEKSLAKWIINENE